METQLEQILTNSYKAEMIAYMKSHPADFEEAIQLAIADKQPYSWRAAWLLWSCMEVNDPRVREYIHSIVDALTKVADNQLRELLLVLFKMELDDEYEGRIFDICMNTWESIGKKPSIRHRAFLHITKIAKKHPELRNEIQFLTQSHYMDSLSDGVKRAVNKMVEMIVYK